MKRKENILIWTILVINLTLASFLIDWQEAGDLLASGQSQKASPGVESLHGLSEGLTGPVHPKP